MKKLTQSFYNRPTRLVAQQLLGKFLINQCGRRFITGKILEVEAYVGPNDKASHASRGLTPRTRVMFGPPGYWYVYLIYGMHYCLNIVTERQNYPAAILIRAVHVNQQIINGPGKVCRAFKINQMINNTPAFGNQATLWIAADKKTDMPTIIKKAPRIGVDYAGTYKDKKWRYSLS